MNIHCTTFLSWVYDGRLIALNCLSICAGLCELLTEESSQNVFPLLYKSWRYGYIRYVKNILFYFMYYKKLLEVVWLLIFFSLSVYVLSKSAFESLTPFRYTQFVFYIIGMVNAIWTVSIVRRNSLQLDICWQTCCSSIGLWFI